MEFPLSVQGGLFVTREIKARGREKGLSEDTPRTVPLRTNSIGSLFWGLSPLLPLKESSVKRMKINLILLSRSGWKEPQTRYWKTKTGFFTHDTLIFTSPQHLCFSSPSLPVHPVCRLPILSQQQLVLSTKCNILWRPTT